MTMFSYINDNLARIKFDVKIGLIPCSVIKHFQVYSRYDYYRRLGNTVSSSVVYAAFDLSVTESWVYVIINKMETEI
jgi:hypothetical protein